MVLIIASPWGQTQLPDQAPQGEIVGVGAGSFGSIHDWTHPPSGSAARTGSTPLHAKSKQNLPEGLPFAYSVVQPLQFVSTSSRVVSPKKR